MLPYISEHAADHCLTGDAAILHPSRMRRCNLVLMIALVGPTTVSSVAAASSSSPAKPPPKVAALVEALVRGHPKNFEIVTFGDPRLAPVEVVRGGAGHAGAVVAPVRPIPARARSGGTTEIVSFADRRETAVTVLRGSAVMVADPDPFAAQAADAFGLFAAPGGIELDRVAFAIDGAESSHGADPAMWRPDLEGPEGPMQVSAAAAIDSGGGDRFDPIQNRRMGRDYLALLYQRYGNWPDAVAAYNWGPGNMDAWIAGGRPQVGLPLEVAHYRARVLRDGDMRQPPALPAPGEREDDRCDLRPKDRKVGAAARPKQQSAGAGRQR